MIRQDWSTLKKLMFAKTAAGGAEAVEYTATGNPLTFLTDLARPLKSMLIPFTPKQEGSGDPSPSNVRNIVPWNGLTVWNGGKNLFDEAQLAEESGITYESGYYTGTRLAFHTAFSGGLPILPKFKETTRYTLSATGYNSEATSNTQFVVTYTDGTQGILRFTETEPTRKTITTTSGKTVANIAISYGDKSSVIFYVKDIQLEEGTTETDYVPCSVTETDISFASPVYGGTLDAVSGELWATYSFIEKKWNEGIIPTVLGDYTRKQYNMGRETTTAQASKETERFCNIAPWLVQYSDQSTHYYFYQASEGEQCIAFVFLPTNTDPTTTIQLAVALKNPVLVGTLTQQQITALVGNNTIWSDADGSMTAIYLKKG